MNTAKRAPSGLKRLTPSMEVGLKCMMDGKADFFKLARAGCNGASAANLVKHGLATKTTDEPGNNNWEITDAGKTAFASGNFRPVAA